jgi:MoxR-like ATPase
VVAFVQRLRTVELFKLPGVAESIDWTRALLALGKDELDARTVDETLGVLLKYQDDVSRIRGAETEATLAEVGRELAAAPASGVVAAPEAT